MKSEELQRYNRHIILPEIGLEGQQKLKRAAVLVIGAGGLGCPVLQYLTAAGVGTIGIADFDVVEESNLQRQILYNSADVGKSKAESAAEKLKLQNPFVHLNAHNLKIDKDNALELIRSYDIVIDGSDNFSTRYLVADSCVILNKPLVFGSIFKFEGQVSVFNYKNAKGEKGPTYRCLFPEAPGTNEVPNCSEVGVLGVLPGIVGTLQANEAIKIITNIGKVLSGRLLMMDALQMKFTEITFSANPENYNIQKLGDYTEEICTPSTFGREKELSVHELKEKMTRGEKFTLIDVREEYEHEICDLGGKLMPMNTIPQRVEEIPANEPVVFYCHRGIRSAMIVKFLHEEFGYTNLYNLEGGIHAWATQVDKTMAKY